MQSTVSDFDSVTAAAAPVDAGVGALEQYACLWRRALEGDAAAFNRLATARQELTDDASLAEALEGHWSVVEDLVPDPAIQRAREAQGELVAAFERIAAAQRRSAEALAEAFAQKSRQLEALLECLPAMTFIKDDLLRYLFVDEAYAGLFGQTSSQVISRTDRDLFSEAEAKRFEELDRQALEQGLVVESRDLLDTPAGPVWVRSLRSPVWNSHGRASSLLGVLFKDEPPLARSERAGRELAQIAHEIRTPLTAVKEALAVIREGAGGALNNCQNEFAGIAARNCGRLERLLEQAIDLERLGGSGPPLVLEWADLTAIVERACERARSWAPGAAISATTITAGLRAKVDVDLLTRMIAELIVLAAQCSASRGVRVGLRGVARQAELIVDCDGDLKSLIDPLAGAGIAQSFVGRAAAAHGATVGARLSGPFRGIYVELPTLADVSGGGESKP